MSGAVEGVEKEQRGELEGSLFMRVSGPPFRLHLRCLGQFPPLISDRGGGYEGTFGFFRCSWRLSISPALPAIDYPMCNRRAHSNP